MAENSEPILYFERPRGGEEDERDQAPEEQQLHRREFAQTELEARRHRRPERDAQEGEDEGSALGLSCLVTNGNQRTNCLISRPKSSFSGV